MDSYWQINPNDTISTVSDHLENNDLDGHEITIIQDSDSVEGKHIDLNGSSSRLVAPNDADFRELTSFTFGAWYYVEEDQPDIRPHYAGHADQSASTGDGSITWLIHGDDPPTSISAGLGGQSNDMVSINAIETEWFHLSLRFDGNNLDLIINGLIEDSASAGNPADNGDDFIIGGPSDGSRRLLEGSVDAPFWSRESLDLSVINDIKNISPRGG